MLEELGSIVDIEDDGAQSGTVRQRGYSCPLASTVETSPGQQRTTDDRPGSTHQR